MFSELLQRFAIAIPARIKKKKPNTDPKGQKAEEEKPKNKKPKEKTPKKDDKNDSNKDDSNVAAKHPRDCRLPEQGLPHTSTTLGLPAVPQIQATLQPTTPSPSFFETWHATAEAVFIPMIICLMALVISYTIWSLILKGTELFLDLLRGVKVDEDSDDVEIMRYENYEEWRLEGKTSLR